MCTSDQVLGRVHVLVHLPYLIFEIDKKLTYETIAVI